MLHDYITMCGAKNTSLEYLLLERNHAERLWSTLLKYLTDLPQIVNVTQSRNAKFKMPTYLKQNKEIFIISICVEWAA